MRGPMRIVPCNLNSNQESNVLGVCSSTLNTITIGDKGLHTADQKPRKGYDNCLLYTSPYKHLRWRFLTCNLALLLQ